MNKKEQFFDEIQYIKDNRYKELAKALVECLPDYFFHEALPP